MAKYLTFDKRDLNNSGLLPLRRGDDWLLRGKVIEKYAKYESPYDLSGMSGSAFFENATGGALVKQVTVVDANSGDVEIAVAASGLDSTMDVGLAGDGMGIYMVMDGPNGLQTIEMQMPILEVKDREILSP